MIHTYLLNYSNTKILLVQFAVHYATVAVVKKVPRSTYYVTSLPFQSKDSIKTTITIVCLQQLPLPPPLLFIAIDKCTYMCTVERIDGNYEL